MRCFAMYHSSLASHIKVKRSTCGGRERRPFSNCQLSSSPISHVPCLSVAFSWPQRYSAGWWKSILGILIPCACQARHVRATPFSRHPTTWPSDRLFESTSIALSDISFYRIWVWWSSTLVTQWLASWCSGDLNDKTLAYKWKSRIKSSCCYFIFNIIQPHGQSLHEYVVDWWQLRPFCQLKMLKRPQNVTKLFCSKMNILVGIVNIVNTDYHESSTMLSINNIRNFPKS